MRVIRQGLFGLCAWAAMVSTGWGHGDLHERIEALTVEIAREPRPAPLYLQRGELHRQHGDFAAAHRDLNQAEKLDPDLPGVRITRARVYLEQNEARKAVAEIDLVLEREPRRLAALTLKAQALDTLGEFSGAAEAWQRVIDSSPSPDVDPYFRRAESLARCGEKSYPAALRTLDDGIGKLGNIPALVLYAIEIEARLGRFEAALARNERMKPLSGRVEDSIERRGDLLLRAGKRAEAHQAFVEALAVLAERSERIRATKAGRDLEARLARKIAETRRK